MPPNNPPHPPPRHQPQPHKQTLPPLPLPINTPLPLRPIHPLDSLISPRPLPSTHRANIENLTARTQLRRAVDLRRGRRDSLARIIGRRGGVLAETDALARAPFLSGTAHRARTAAVASVRDGCGRVARGGGGGAAVGSGGSFVSACGSGACSAGCAAGDDFLGGGADGIVGDAGDGVAG